MNEGSSKKSFELGPVTRAERAIKALHELVQAAAPIEEDGGSDQQREDFSLAFQSACFTLFDLDPDNKLR